MKVHHVKAGKDYPQFKIEKGQMHYVWTFFRGATVRSLTRPTRSQLTNSEFLSTFYDYVDKDLPAVEDAADLEELATNVRQHAEEERGKIDELPENFQQGPLGEKYENRASELEDWAGEIDTAIENLGEKSEYDPEDHGGNTWEEHLAEVISELESSAPSPE